MPQLGRYLSWLEIDSLRLPSRQSRERDYMKELKSIAVQQDVVTNHPLKATMVVSVSISSEFFACMCMIDFQSTKSGGIKQHCRCWQKVW